MLKVRECHRTQLSEKKQDASRCGPGGGVVRAWFERGNDKLSRGNAKLYRGNAKLYRGPQSPQIWFKSDPKEPQIEKTQHHL